MRVAVWLCGLWPMGAGGSGAHEGSGDQHALFWHFHGHARHPRHGGYHLKKNEALLTANLPSGSLPALLRPGALLRHVQCG